MNKYQVRKALDIAAVTVILMAALLIFGCSPAAEETITEDEPEGQEETGVNEDMESDGGEEEILFEEVELAGRVFKLELALTDEERALGLMWRELLAEDQGMLFVYPDREPYPTELGFWMKNCLIPIDVIFLSRNGYITAIHEMQPPEPGTPDQELAGYYSEGPAQFAIEIRGGLAAELGLQEGDYINLSGDYLMGLAE